MMERDEPVGGGASAAGPITTRGEARAGGQLAGRAGAPGQAGAAAGTRDGPWGQDRFRAVNPVTERIIGAAITVHREIGPGLLESAYQACMAVELADRGLRFVRQYTIPVVYKGHELEAGYRADFLVENAIILELKAVARPEPIFTAQMITYLKLSGHHVGLMINFNVPLLKDGIQRIVL